MLAQVFRPEHGESAVHRIAHQNSVVSAKRNAIPKPCRIRILEQEPPGCAAIQRFVEPGRVPGSAGQDNGVISVPGPDSAKVETPSIGWHRAFLPYESIIFTAQHGSARS